MTRFSAPLKVKKPFSETVVVSADASGNFAISGDMAIAGSSDFIGPISAGSAAATGYATLTQTTTVVSNTEKIKVAQLPEGADITDWYFYVTTAFGTAASDITLRVGTSANETLLGSISMDGSDQFVGGMKRPVETTAGQTTNSGWSGVTGAGAVFYAAVTVASGAVASGASGIVGITYVHKV